jgi:hypothetical protein
MGTRIDLSVIADSKIRNGLLNGSMNLFGSVVRSAETGRIIKHLPQLKALNPKDSFSLIAAAGVAVVIVTVGITTWFQSKKQNQFPLKKVLTALENDLKEGNLDLETAQNLREQLSTFVNEWENVPKEKRVQIPKNEIEALQNLLKLLKEINKQLPPQALEAGEVTGSMQILERVLLVKNMAN